MSDSEEKAEKNARQFLWMQGEFTGLAHPVWSSPSGYFSPEHRRQFVEFRSDGQPARPADIEKQVADGGLHGTPDTVIPKLRRVLEETRPSIYGLWGNDGSVSPDDAKTCIRLLGQEVMPAMREIGKESASRIRSRATPRSTCATRPTSSKCRKRPNNLRNRRRRRPDRQIDDPGVVATLPIGDID